MATANTKRNINTEANDLYNTPLDALEAAWDAGVFDRFDVYYDPCDGLGKISDFLVSKGKIVYCSDLIKYKDNAVRQDFMEVNFKNLPITEDECIVFNPPFKLTEEFIDHALSLCDNLIMFNRATVLETSSRSRKHSSKEWPLKEFYSFANRVSCTQGVDQSKTNNAVWYGWYVYDKNYTGDPTIKWLFTK